MKGDYCTREGAEKLKEQIEAYWAERGHDVRINLIQGGFLASNVLTRNMSPAPSASLPVIIGVCIL